MLIVTAKLSKGKLIGIVAAAAALLILIIFLANRGTGTSMETAAPGKLSTPEQRVAYLASLGYTVVPSSFTCAPSTRMSCCSSTFVSGFLTAAPSTVTRP